MVIQASGQRAFWIAVAIIAIGTSGCASLRSATSGQVGCAEDEIAITKYNASLGSRTWTAECRGKRFYCSVVETGAQQSQVSCREEVSSTVSAEVPAPARSNPPPSGAAGCQYDTQCKGDRVCVDSKCQDPPAR